MTNKPLWWKLTSCTCLMPVALSTSVAFAQGGAAAQDQAGGDGGEIIVTATRQEVTLSKVPLSVAAFNQETLDRQGSRSVDDIARLTPGVTFSRGDARNSGAANISIRGISSTAGSATTGIYIDDTPIQTRSLGYGSFSSFPAVFDLDRVEILRGPQGTLFGAGSEGGTVRFLTPQPDLDDFKIYGRAELATTKSGAPSYEIGAAASAPLVPGKLAARVSAYYRRDGGYIDRVDYRTGDVLDKNSNSQGTVVFQGAIAWQATEQLKITPSVFFQRVTNDDGNAYWENLSDRSDNDYRNGNALANTNHDRFILPALKLDWEGDKVALISNTSYFSRDQSSVSDYSSFEASIWAGNPFFPPEMAAASTFTNTQRNFTQEVRLQSADPDSRLTWVVGGFYSHNRQEAIQYVEDTYLPTLIQQNIGISFEQFFGQPLVDGRYTSVMDKAVTIEKQLAAFGQIDFAVTPKLKLTVGLRYAKAKLDASASFVGPVIGPPVNDQGGQKEKPLTPKFGLSYQASEDTLVYANAAKGYRIGGYNFAVGLPCGVSSTGTPVPGTELGALGLTNRPAFFDSDSVWSYEAGAKSKFLNRKLSVEASAFWIDWKNIQQTVALNGCGFNFTDNLGSATSKGFDVQFQLAATDNLTIGGSVGYTKAKFNDTVLAGPSATRNLVTEGDLIDLHPWQVYLNAQYRFDLMGQQAYIRGDYQYLSALKGETVNLNPLNGTADLTIPAQQEVNNLSLRAGLSFDGFDLSVFANNVTNGSATLARSHDPGTTLFFRRVTQRPRTLGVTATFRY
ncbi:TonB-dependent receptor precursor [Sphingomonas paucimobilis]|nr:TonB-dependent receptor precursor [Sphingomonas paucimobilis]